MRATNFVRYAAMTDATKTRTAAWIASRRVACGFDDLV
jgi:hypothetical protein